MLIVVDWDAVGVEPPGLRVLDVVVSVGARLLVTPLVVPLAVLVLVLWWLLVVEMGLLVARVVFCA